MSKKPKIGGPAGLELTGALAEMKKFVIPKEFPDLELSKMSIYLYEVGPQCPLGLILKSAEIETKKPKKEHIKEIV